MPTTTTIREMTTEDITEGYIEALNDIDLNRHMDYHTPQTKQTATSYLQHQTPQNRQFGIFIDNLPVGGIRIRLTDPQSKIYTIAYMMYDKTQQRCGHMHYALKHIIDLYTSLGARTIEASTHAPNIPSRRLLEKLGFIHHGTAHNIVLCHGRAEDRVYYHKIIGARNVSTR